MKRYSNIQKKQKTQAKRNKNRETEQNLANNYYG